MAFNASAQAIFDEQAVTRAAHKSQFEELKQRIAMTIDERMDVDGLTQEQLGFNSGHSAATIGRVLHGHDLRLSTLHDIANALGFELHVVLAPKAQ